MIFKRVATVAAIAAAAFVGLPLAHSAEPLNIRVGWVVAPGSLGPLLFAKPELQKHAGTSYTFEPIHFASTAVEVTPLASGELDIANLSFSGIGLAIENAHIDDLRVFADEIQNGVHGHENGAGFLVLKDGPIKTIEDLKGKVIAVLTLGSATDMQVRTMLRRHHLEDKRDYSLIEAGFPNMKSLLLQGKADMVSIAPPYTDDPDLEAKSRMLFTATDAFGPTQLTAWTARAGFLAKNHAALVDFMEDVIRSLRWWNDPANHHEAIALVAAFTKQQPEAIDWLFTDKDNYRDPNDEPNLAALQANLDTQQALGLLANPIDIRKYADLGIVREAAARLK